MLNFCCILIQMMLHTFVRKYTVGVFESYANALVATVAQLCSGFNNQSYVIPQRTHVARHHTNEALDTLNRIIVFFLSFSISAQHSIIFLVFVGK